MKKIVRLLFLLMLVTVLVACGGTEVESEPETAVNDQEAVPTTVPEQAPTDTPVPTEVVAEPTAEPAEAEPVEEEAVEEETAVSTSDLPSEELLADASAIRANDWAQGTDDPLITIIEYGDFQ